MRFTGWGGGRKKQPKPPGRYQPEFRTHSASQRTTTSGSVSSKRACCTATRQNPSSVMPNPPTYYLATPSWGFGRVFRPPCSTLCRPTKAAPPTCNQDEHCKNCTQITNEAQVLQVRERWRVRCTPCRCQQPIGKPQCMGGGPTQPCANPGDPTPDRCHCAHRS